MKSGGQGWHEERLDKRNAKFGSDNASNRGAIEDNATELLPFLQKLKGISWKEPKNHEDLILHSIRKLHKLLIVKLRPVL